METLLKAWRHLGGTPPLKLAGDGPMAAAVQDAAEHNAGIEWLRGVSHERVYELVGEAAFLVLPSQCYETFARVVMEAFAKGTPVIVSKLGAMAEIVDDGRTGLHFEPRNPEDLAEKVRSILADPPRLTRMRQAARQTFDQNFTADANHKILMAIYERAMNDRSERELQSCC